MNDLALTCRLASEDAGGLGLLDLAALHHVLQRHIYAARLRARGRPHHRLDAVTLVICPERPPADAARAYVLSQRRARIVSITWVGATSRR